MEETDQRRKEEEALREKKLIQSSLASQRDGEMHLCAVNFASTTIPPSTSTDRFALSAHMTALVIGWCGESLS